MSGDVVRQGPARQPLRNRSKQLNERAPSRIMCRMAGKYFGGRVVVALVFVASTVFGAEPASVSVAPEPASELVGKLAPSTREEVRTLPGGITLRVAAGTVIERQRSTRLQLGPPGAPTTLTHVVQLASGRVTATTPKTSRVPSIAVLVQAPRRVSAVAAGGRVEVVVTPEAVTVGALEGEVLSAVKDQWRKLPEGQARSVEDSAAGGAQRAILPAPQVRAAQTLILAPSDGSGSLACDWAAIPKAVSYAVRVTADAAVVREFNVTSTRATIEGVRAGRYAISVAAVDRYGLSGKDSTANVRALGLELPAGARQLGNSIQIERRQRIHLTDPQGLEVTYGNASAFVPAPGDIGLAGGAPTLVRIRASGEPGELSLRLVPFEVHTGISLVTGARGWPREAGTLRIAFRDGQGRLLARAPDAAVEVRVNRQPVQVRWQRRGGLIEGTLPARGGWGPYSVAVRVTDKHGAQIGREIVQVAAAEPTAGLESKPR